MVKPLEVCVGSLFSTYATCQPQYIIKEEKKTGLILSQIPGLEISLHPWTTWVSKSWQHKNYGRGKVEAENAAVFIISKGLNYHNFCFHGDFNTDEIFGRSLKLIYR